ncbi:MULTISPECIES: hypothetical protein [unclassified Pseudomonas]|uniref:hypothetical protein n=1 Tax=unclassified Pseudomonas TaxID=196821 RepID=UPI000A1DDB6C|nr:MULTISPECIES: hypothetical protein [unclassified Pseudomonas]
MNQKRTRIPLPHPPPYRESRVSFWLTVLVGVMLAFAIGASLYLIADSLISGSVTTMNRTGPRQTYTLASQPGRYWFEIVWQGVFTLMLLGIVSFGLWIRRKTRPRGARSKRTRR